MFSEKILYGYVFLQRILLKTWSTVKSWKRLIILWNRWWAGFVLHPVQQNFGYNIFARSIL